jgi:site-specific DNA-methyltransferase (adenine-specific)
MAATFSTPCGRADLHLGDCIDVIDALDGEQFDAIVTDPPYSSGGVSMADRAADPVAKYQQTGQKKQWATFSGDNRDQRSWAFWSTIWMRRAKRLLRPSGYILAFTDWRQMPTTTDAIQAAGYIWRGVVPWDKGRSARAPHKGYFRHQCEYVVWGTLGTCRKAIRWATHGVHSHSGMITINGNGPDLMEVREFIGGRRIPLSAAVADAPGRIDIFRPREEFNPNQIGATRLMREITARRYGYWGIARLALQRVPFLWRFCKVDTRDRPPHGC